MSTEIREKVWINRVLFGHDHPGCVGVIRGNVFEKQKLNNIGKGSSGGQVLRTRHDGLIFCSHPSHEGQVFDRCLDCGEVEELTDLLGCVDVDACQERRAERLSQHPVWKLLREVEVEAAARTSERNAERAVARQAALAAEGEGKVTEGPRRAKGRGGPDPLGGRCNHCGEPTKGGRFIAGHDAKLKGDLMRSAVEGNVKSILEMLIRGWLKRPQLLESSKLKLAEDTVEQMTENDGIEWLKGANERRWES